jgi:hypothetical protein
MGESMSLTLRIHKAVFLAYITQTLCKNKALQDFEQYLETSKLKLLQQNTSTASSKSSCRIQN